MGGRLRAGLAIVGLLAAALAVPAGVRADTLLVFAAASLKEALDEVVRGFESGSTHRVRVAYGASSALARQLEAGAPAHVFISADVDWMGHVASRNLLKSAPVRLLGNQLVIVAPMGAAPALSAAPGFALLEALRGGRLAMADPRSVPAGKYAKAALQSLGAWKSVESRLAPTDSVRSALALVARGEAPLGIVYRTDAQASTGVVIVDAIPPHTHAPIVYPMAVMRRAPRAADELARYLASPAAHEAWRRHGFVLPD